MTLVYSLYPPDYPVTLLDQRVTMSFEVCSSQAVLYSSTCTKHL